MFEEFALLARKLRRRKNADVIVEVTLAATARVGKTLALNTEDGAALRGFRDF